MVQQSNTSKEVIVRERLESRKKVTNRESVNVPKGSSIEYRRGAISV
eukprot:COSAG01_NODE_33801_length_558_cov_1.226580_2_plen_46_part_01